ncbi:MAG: hypothetical protein C0599_01950 [Salinivirgaceae bacterium]|nr:MAG: hypothetical protein C0599_01950 [Salinivirgaceae bacterium]
MTNKPKKKAKQIGLNDEDKTIINRQMRAGIVVSFLLIIIGFGATLGTFFLDKSDPKIIEPGELWIPLVGVAVLANGIFMLMNRKYLADLKEGSKTIETKKIQRKEIKKSHEAGGGVYSAAKPIDIHYIIVENTRYEVTPEEFEKANEGGEVLFHYALKSNFLIKTEIK